MMTKVRNMILVVMCAMMMTSCSMWNNETNGTILGGIGGALLGGAVGEAVGGHHGADWGAYIGSAIGSAAGASAGREKDRQKAAEYYYYNSNSRNDYSSNYTSNNSYYDRESGVTYVRMNNDGDVQFASNSTSLDGQSKSALNRICKQLARCNNDIYLYGSADSRERNAYNLSEGRANVVSRYLTSKGISSRRIHVVALGNDSPIGNNNTEGGRALNRTVEVFIIR